MWGYVTRYALRVERMKAPWVISGLTLVADQLTKFLTVISFAPGQSLPVLPPVLHLTYVQNTGVAFGLFKGHQALSIVLSLLVIGWLVRELLTSPWSPPGKPGASSSTPQGGRHPAPPDESGARCAGLMAPATMWGCALILGGAAGNLIDRLHLGYVVDFIDLRVWPVFNIGDSAITIGVTLLLWQSLARVRQKS